MLSPSIRIARDVRRQLRLGVACFALMLVALLIALQSFQAHRDLHHAQSEALARSQEILRLQQQLAALRAQTLSLAAVSGPRLNETALQTLAEAASTLQAQADALALPGEHSAPSPARDTLRQSLTDIAVAHRAAAQVARDGAPLAGIGAGLAERTGPQFADASRALAETLAVSQQNLEAEQRRLDTLTDFTQMVLVVCALLTLVLGALFAVLAWRGVAANRQLFGKLDQLAHEDALTGVMNRRGLDEALPVELQRADRLSYPMTVVMLDLDHFKRYNDKRGHGAGDALLRGAAQGWRRQLRPTDILARYGGEEFTLVLPACEAEQALQLVDRLRTLMPDNQTFSAGVAQRDVGESALEVLARADQALLQAKRTGRNKSVVAERQPQMGLPLRAA